MCWEEVDMERALWRIPGDRTKTGMEHLVPLSRQAKAVPELLSRSPAPGVWFPRSR